MKSVNYVCVFGKLCQSGLYSSVYAKSISLAKKKNCLMDRKLIECFHFSISKLILCNMSDEYNF